MPKLSDTQLILLASAAQRDDGSVLPLPDTLAAKAASTEKSILALVKRKHPAGAALLVAARG